MSKILSYIENKLIALELEEKLLSPGCDMSHIKEEEWRKRVIEIKANIELLLELKSLKDE